MELVYVLFTDQTDNGIKVRGIFTDLSLAEKNALKLVEEIRASGCTCKEVVDPRDTMTPKATANVEFSILREGVLRAWDSDWEGIWIEERKLNALAKS